MVRLQWVMDVGSGCGAASIVVGPKPDSGERLFSRRLMPHAQVALKLALENKGQLSVAIGVDILDVQALNRLGGVQVGIALVDDVALALLEYKDLVSPEQILTAEPAVRVSIHAGKARLEVRIAAVELGRRPAADAPHVAHEQDAAQARALRNGSRELLHSVTRALTVRHRTHSFSQLLQTGHHRLRRWSVQMRFPADPARSQGSQREGMHNDI